MRNFLIVMVLAFVATGCCHMKKTCPVGCDKPCCAGKAMDAAAPAK